MRLQAFEKRGDLSGHEPCVTSRWMKISVDDVRHVALLARLELSPEEEGLLVRQLDTILGYIDKLNELDTEGVAPTSHVLELGAVFREDVVENRPETEALLRNAPERSGNFFKVPKIIE